MFESRKIKRLIQEYSEVETEKVGSQMISELEKFGNVAVQHTIEAFGQGRLTPEKAQSLLERLCDDSSVESIVSLISDPHGEVRRVSKELIIKRKGWWKFSLPLLMESLKSKDFYLRNSATELLATIKDRSCVPQLVSMFNGAEPEMKKNIVKILSGMGGETASKLLISALSDESWEVRLSAVKSLGKMKSPETVGPLIERLMENDPQMKRLALDSLGAIGDKRAAAPMIALLKDHDMLIRQKATEYIIKIAEADIVPDILNLMKDKDVNVRRCATEVLNNLKDPRTSDALIKAMKDSDWWVRQIATDSLTNLKGDKIVKAFIAMTHDPDENIRRCAVEFFNKVPDKSSFESLSGLLKDEDWWVREKAVTAIGKLRDKRAIPLLAEMIDDQEAKWVVPAALAHIGGDEVLEHLKEFFLDDVKRVRIEAIKAFGKLKATGAVADLKECLNDPDCDISSEAVSALKEITGKKFKAKEGPAPKEVSDAAMSRVKAEEGAILTEAITVLDLCNSTDIASRYGDNFALNIMKILSDIVTQIAKRERFKFMKNTGDGFLITFSKTDNSVRFALDVLKAVDRHNEKADENRRINLRFGINLGETRVDQKGDRLGAAVNMTFRVEGVKPEALIPIEGGMEKEEVPLDNRVFMTENAYKEIGDLEGVKTRLVGLFELKGITGLHKIFQLTSIN